MAKRGRAATEMDADGYKAWGEACDARDDMRAATGETGGPEIGMIPRPLHLPVEFEPDSFEVMPRANPGDIVFDPDLPGAARTAHRYARRRLRRSASSV